MKPLVIGHRGAAGYLLENTTASFQKAIDLGVDGIEFDIHESKDGEFIVIHDSHTGRVAPLRYLVNKSNSATLKAIRLHQKQRLLTLNEAFEIIPPNIGLIVEIKSLKSVVKLVKLVEIQAVLRSLILTSFDLTLLSKIQTCTKKISIGIVSKSSANISKAKEMNIRFSDVCLDFQSLTANLVSQWRLQKLRIFAWTVDHSKDIEKMLDLEVDGIISNKPDRVNEILLKRQNYFQAE
jgi:glycerophosphoryl diester phosphodiesterase